MVTRDFKILFLLFAVIFSSITDSKSQDEQTERHIAVSMRMIGHAILLDAGDSVSRVLPIEKNAGRYGIAFESEFAFNPGNLVATIDSVVQQTQIASCYLVEIEECATGDVVHSYEIGNSAINTVVPCGTRSQPSACYQVFITLMDQNSAAAPSLAASNGSFTEPPKGSQNPIYWTTLALLVPAVLLTGFLTYYVKKRRNSETEIPINPHLISIGKYQFDKKRMELSLGNETTELTAKEADLLDLLYSSANETLERETILSTVWGDNGDYVGRTLDVFISKLRKKLEGDSSIKIANIRGIGYKLVIA